MPRGKPVAADLPGKRFYAGLRIVVGGPRWAALTTRHCRLCNASGPLGIETRFFPACRRTVRIVESPNLSSPHATEIMGLFYP